MTNQTFAVLDALGVKVKYVQMPPDRDGEYDHRRQLIRVQMGLPERAHRSVLAHECAHAVFADVPSMFGPVNRKQERRADEWAALHLIDIESYKRAEVIHHGHSEAMAVELNVLLELVEAYQRTLQRIDDTVYLRPRMGAGQWAHREQVA
ncbi:hypothetical protein GCM10009775_04230 [Microbacterium aoyamense]|uniref:IrrE N-terminal-like domain-containing protein n=1 Tax=Microbacterium aoyamense TaxID=344166 RepID=A0ABP5ALD6_9MICO|nr:ImmA/IrrE family metallo-endopeptidase [Microbacterium aoyamense]